MQRQVLPHLLGLMRCDYVPVELSLLLAEPIAQFRVWDRIAARCRTGRTLRRVDAVSDFVDVSGDAAFSRAELERVFRVTGFFVTYELGLANQVANGTNAGFVIDAAPLQGDVLMSDLLCGCSLSLQTDEGINVRLPRLNPDKAGFRQFVGGNITASNGIARLRSANGSACI